MEEGFIRPEFRPIIQVDETPEGLLDRLEVR